MPHCWPGPLRVRSNPQGCSLQGEGQGQHSGSRAGLARHDPRDGANLLRGSVARPWGLPQEMLAPPAHRQTARPPPSAPAPARRPCRPLARGRSGTTSRALRRRTPGCGRAGREGGRDAPRSPPERCQQCAVACGARQPAPPAPPERLCLQLRARQQRPHERGVPRVARQQHRISAELHLLVGQAAEVDALHAHRGGVPERVATKKPGYGAFNDVGPLAGCSAAWPRRAAPPRCAERSGRRAARGRCVPAWVGRRGDIASAACISSATALWDASVMHGREFARSR